MQTDAELYMPYPGPNTESEEPPISRFQNIHQNVRARSATAAFETGTVFSVAHVMS
jgi:hypothetical protein